VGSGGSASFSVTANGTAPFAYYWYQNGSLLTGQNASVLNIASAQANASYTVVVSNAAGSVTSAPVR
jgi:membrane carboxypeptidase/penicillin-binding protein PbpC